MCLVGQMQLLKLGAFRISSGRQIVVLLWSLVEPSAYNSGTFKVSPLTGQIMTSSFFSPKSDT